MHTQHVTKSMQDKVTLRGATWDVLHSHTHRHTQAQWTQCQSTTLLT